MLGLRPLLLGAILAYGSACGSATFYVEEEEPLPRDPMTTGEGDADAVAGWKDASVDLIPEPPRGPWSMRGTAVDDQRSLCAREIDVSRAYVSRAIEMSLAVGARDRVKCLSRNAALLTTLKTIAIIGSPRWENGPGDEPLDAACTSARNVVWEARSCL